MNFRPHFDTLSEIQKDVLVKNPSTGKDERQTMYLLAPERVIEPKLRVDDFTLQKQIQSGVGLCDCSKYFEPSIDQYDSMFRGLGSNLSRQAAAVKLSELKDVQPSQVSESKTE